MTTNCNRLRTKTINKTARLSSAVLRELDRIPELMTTTNNAFLQAAKNVAGHFRISPVDSDLLLMAKKKELPNVILKLLPNSANKVPTYDAVHNTIVSYNEPWSFMHEYAHAGNRANLLRKLRRILPVKTKISSDDFILLNNYLEENYITSGGKGHEMGRNIQDLVSKTRVLKEKDTWRFLEELRADAQAYYDTKNVSGDRNAYKIFQPLAVNDANQVAVFRHRMNQKRVSV